MIDLTNPDEQCLVQLYAERICMAKSAGERDFLTGKLAHAYEVIRMAERLTDLAPDLDASAREIIWRGACLHDIGRPLQWKDGAFHRELDHGKLGAAYFSKRFPGETTIASVIEWHNRMPSDADPPAARPYLDFVRDADMLANLKHNADDIPYLYDRLKGISSTRLEIDGEFYAAARAKRPILYKNIKNESILTIVACGLAWQYNLRTPAAEKLRKKEFLFTSYRDRVIAELIDLLDGSDAEKKAVKQELASLFSDEVLGEKE
ncbi:MAG: HD domain-containing protein [Alphaproteobacteria bacterium]|nr:HD domain-containing protein [Alphaproteobacteria bacterium]